MAKKRPAEELNVEDLFFAESGLEQDYLELPLSRQTFFLVGLGIAIIGLIALGRLGFLNVFKGEFYANRSLANVFKETELPAPRGIIFDRYGKPLVENKSSFSAFLRAGELLKTPEKISEAADKLNGVLGIPKGELEEIIKNSDLEKKISVSLARNISVEQAIELKSLNLPYVYVEDDYIRQYVDPQAFSHVLGYLGVSDKDRDLVGRSGLELQYDSVIKGKDGALIAYRDAAGKVLDKKVSYAPEAGSNLYTTLDGDLQTYFYHRLANGLAALGRDAGVGIAINPKNGEILALISLPSFDNNKVAKYLNSRSQPLFNRAISGAYNPGSTIKPLVALAALKEGVANQDLQILSIGYIEIPNPYDLESPSRFVDWKPHGWVDVHSALAKSSNVYFYALGGGLPRSEMDLVRGLSAMKGLGIEKLNQYWREFLLGQKTGIDLPNEIEGFLPDSEEKEKRTGQIWRVGDTYNVSIGQGDLLLSPIQLINFINSVANGGKIYRPKLVNQSEPEILLNYSGWSSEIKEVQEGMEDAVKKPYGTANLLSLLPVSSAGKTGSAQVANNTRTNAFFVGYAPAENAEITVLVLIENAKEGSLNAVPIAKDVLEWYYYNRLVKGL